MSCNRIYKEPINWDDVQKELREHIDNFLMSEEHKQEQRRKEYVDLQNMYLYSKSMNLKIKRK